MNSQEQSGDVQCNKFSVVSSRVTELMQAHRSQPRCVMDGGLIGCPWTIRGLQCKCHEGQGESIVQTGAVPNATHKCKS